jgi:hypothetical protein
MVDTLSVWGIGTFGTTEDTSFIYKLKPPGVWYRLPMQNFMYSKLSCIAAHDTSKAWVGTYDGEIYMTTNGGYKWERIFSFGGSSFINDIKFSKTNKLIGYANSDPPNGSGTPFKILKTTNGGLNWVTLSPIFANNYFGAVRSSCVTDENHYWMGLNCSFCGVPKLAFTTNGGVNWQQNTLQISNHFVEPIEFTTDNSLGYCSSYGGTFTYYIHRTINGGFSWTNYYILPIESGQPLNSLNWIEGTSNWYFSSSSISLDAIYKSTNNGVNWSPMVINNDHDQVINLSFIRKNNSIWGYASTYNGKIFKLIRDTAVISSIKLESNNVPDKFSLGQNYPNPFNPTTKIRFSIANGFPMKTFGNDKVVLIVYDVMGREVETLVNESLKPGTYETSFDGSMLNSGVYFYKLITDGYTETRKMLLIK